MKVFISFHRDDFTSIVASEIRQDLRRYEIDAWSFLDASVAGRLVEEEYADRVQQSEAVIVLWDAGAMESPHVLKELELAAGKRIIPICLDKSELPRMLKGVSCILHTEAHNRNHLVRLLLLALGRDHKFEVNDKFWTSQVRWKTYDQPHEAYPLWGRDDSLLLVGSGESRMSIQSESEGRYGTLRVVARSGHWRTDTSVGLEKWVDSRRYSLRVEGNGMVTIDNGLLPIWARLRGSAHSFPIDEWPRIKKRDLKIEFRWSKERTTVHLNERVVCDVATSIHVPLRIRLNADVADSLRVSRAEWPTWSTA